MPGHDKSSSFPCPGSGLGHRLVVISRRKWRRTKPPIHGRAKETTPVRKLSVNRKPLRNCLSLAHPPAFRNGLYSLHSLPEASLLQTTASPAAMSHRAITASTAKFRYA